MENSNILYQASCGVSEIKHSDIYMSIVLQLFSTSVNLNGVRVEEAFIDEIVDNSDKYIGLPLCVDKRMLKAGLIHDLGHRMNPSRTQFTTEPIGAFVQFWKEQENGETVLYGLARVAKRDKHICDMLQKMYDAGNLKVSFEILSEHCRREDNVVVVDANPRNVLLALAIVSAPAYPDASSAVLMVAEKEETATEAKVEPAADAVASEEEGEKMNEEIKIPEEQVEEKIEEQKTEEVETVHETETEEPKEEKQENTEEEPEKEPEEEPAEEKPEEEKTTEADFDMPENQHEILEDVAELKLEIERLNALVQELLPYKEAAETNAKNEKIAKMRGFAEKNGLDLESEEVIAAIEAMNYEALMELSMEQESHEETHEEPNVQMASFDKMNIDNMRSFLYQRAK